MNDGTRARIQEMIGELYKLSDSQLGWIESIIRQFSIPHQYALHNSGLFSQCMLDGFGDALLFHHCLSKEAFSKDKFEYVLERISNMCGRTAQIARRGNPGHDITIDGERLSLKTQADADIREDRIHISKFMELGQGKWGDDPKDLEGLRDQFLSHLNSYDRILSLRALSKAPQDWWYELVEVPKGLLQEARTGELEMKSKSLQVPKPGYCYVRDEKGEDKFQLYFDGGTERKLQIKHLRKEYCRLHAAWRFPAVDLYTKS